MWCSDVGNLLFPMKSRQKPCAPGHSDRHVHPWPDMLPFSLDDLLCGVFWFLGKNSLYTTVVRFSFNQKAAGRLQLPVGSPFK